MDLDRRIEEYLQEIRAGGRSEWTVRNYRTALGKFRRWCEESGTDYLTLTPRQARQFRNWLAAGGAGPASVNTAVSALRGFYDYLVEEGTVPGNPIIPSRLRIPEPDAPPRCLTDEETQAALEYVGARFPSALLPFRTMLATGLRVGEAAALTCGDVVSRSGRVMLRVAGGRGGRGRYVPVTDPEVAQELVQAASGRNRPERLFRIRYSTLLTYASRTKRATGVDFTSHRLRHTFAARLLAQGERLDVIQKVLGHKDIGTTTRYATTLAAARERPAARVV